MRAVTPADYPEITDLLEAAFAPSLYESQLVAWLSDHGKLIYEWVSDDERGISGHICFTNAFHGSEVTGLHLDPLAVRSDVQRKGFGSQLIVESLKLFQTKDIPIFVLGDPEFYSQFGFVRVDNPFCPFDQKNQHFLALWWSERSSFVIGYEDEFTQV